jgi:hypothetical protein
MGEGEIAGPLSRFIAMDRQGLAPDHLPALDPAGGGDELPGEAPRGQHAGEHPSENHVGEVVESSTAEALAQARELNRAPCFGRFVLIQSVVPAVGIVFNVSTQSIEANRRPVAYGKTERELRLEQPQIFELLRTHFQILIVGHLDRGAPVPLLPPHPAPIHSFVYECDDALIRACTEDDEFLRNIINTPGMPADQLLIATLRNALSVRGDSHEYLVIMGKALSRLLHDDYDRLRSVVRRIAPGR